jgi:hypothetical protein
MKEYVDLEVCARKRHMTVGLYILEAIRRFSTTLQLTTERSLALPWVRSRFCFANRDL